MPLLGGSSSNNVSLLGGQSRGLPPKYLSIVGHRNCLSSHSPRGVSHTEICLPTVKPVSCNTTAWNELKKEVAAGGVNECQPPVLLGGGVRALPPQYLSIDGHQDCLAEHSPRGASHTEICLPSVKPESCDSNAWTELKQELTAGRINECPSRKKRALPPKYLSIDGHQDCLSDHSPTIGASHREICLPSSKPLSCSTIAWDKLKVEVSARRVDQCRQTIQTLGGQSGLPPSYLSIDGHGDCLSSHSSMPGGGHDEVCIPRSKPQSCTSGAWQKLETELSQGNLNQCRLPIIGLPIRPVLGGGLLALPPKYLKVDGWRNCTRNFKASESHTENCLPLSKPDQPCSPQAYKELLQIAFEVKGTSSTNLPGVLDAQPPEYLFVDGHEKCLDDITVGNHKERCLPSNRPNGCESSTWIQLQNVFEGKPCKRKE